MNDDLSLKRLRSANRDRAVEWNPSEKMLPLSFAMMELAGEVGEACNIAKKIERYEYGIAGGVNDYPALAEELADAVICADLAAIRAGIDLVDAVRQKFNKTSEERGFTTKL